MVEVGRPWARQEANLREPDSGLVPHLSLLPPSPPSYPLRQRRPLRLDQPLTEPRTGMLGPETGNQGASGSRTEQRLFRKVWDQRKDVLAARCEQRTSLCARRRVRKSTAREGGGGARVWRGQGKRNPAGPCSSRHVMSVIGSLQPPPTRSDLLHAPGCVTDPDPARLGSSRWFETNLRSRWTRRLLQPRQEDAHPLTSRRGNPVRSVSKPRASSAAASCSSPAAHSAPPPAGAPSPTAAGLQIRGSDAALVSGSVPRVAEQHTGSRCGAVALLRPVAAGGPRGSSAGKGYPQRTRPGRSAWGAGGGGRAARDAGTGFYSR